MSSELAIRSVPPPVGTLPEPLQATPGKYTIITAPEEAYHPLGQLSRESDDGSTIRLERGYSKAQPWSALLSSWTIMCVLSGDDSGCWTQLTSKAESKLCKELRSYVHLEDNWDGDGAKAPSEAAVNDALTFLNGRPADIPLPYPEEGSEGDVGIYWDISHAHVFAEVTFEGDSTCAYFAVHGVPGAITEKCGNDEVKVTAPWPDDMLRILRIQDST